MVKERPDQTMRPALVVWPMLLCILVVSAATAVPPQIPDPQEALHRIDLLLQATRSAVPHHHRRRLAAALQTARRQTAHGKRIGNYIFSRLCVFVMMSPSYIDTQRMHHETEDIEKRDQSPALA